MLFQLTAKYTFYYRGTEYQQYIIEKIRVQFAETD